MLKFNCQAKTIASGSIYQQGSNMIDLAMCLFFQQFSVSQASYYPCSFISGRLAHVLINETPYLLSELLSVTVWKSENAIVKVCHLTSAYFKSLLVKMIFFPT